jgi:2,5-dihydroxypyridine 5,6-dioxygenase
MIYSFEISRAARILLDRLMGVRPGETVVLTADTGSDLRAVEAAAAAAYECGAKPLIVTHLCPATMGKSGDPYLPVDALSAVLKEADTWVEFDSAGLMFTTPFDVATTENKELRSICMGSGDVDLLVRCVGRVGFDAMAEFESVLIDILRAASAMRMTTAAGTDVAFEQDPKIPLLGTGPLFGEGKPPAGTYTLPGAVAWAPDLSTVNGTVVFDGAIGIPALNLSVLRQPIVLRIEGGGIVEFGGGPEAGLLEPYLKGFDHPQTLRLAHTGIGFNPGAITRGRFGNLLEDERIWGSMHWGIGEISNSLIPGGQIPAPMHCDGICLGCSLEADGAPILTNGNFVHPDLVELAVKLREPIL